MANVQFGLNNYGQNLFGLGSGETQYIVAGDTTATASSAVKFGSFQTIVSGDSSFIISSVETEGAYLNINASTIMIAGPDVRLQAGAIMTTNGSMVGTGSVAWETQQANSISWVTQREHPNG